MFDLLSVYKVVKYDDKLIAELEKYEGKIYILAFNFYNRS